MLNLYIHSVHRAVERLAKDLSPVRTPPRQRAAASWPLATPLRIAPVPVTVLARVIPQRIPRLRAG